MSSADIMDVETTGASATTARGDKLGFSGVRASHEMAKMDAGRMEKYRTKINTVGQSCDIDPALIAAIISRESRAGNALINGWGDGGKAFGLMQVDVTSTGGRHKPQGTWDSKEHIRHGTGALVDKIGLIRAKFPNWSPEMQLKGGIAAYNMGENNVRSYEGVDNHTTGGDYSNDVVARAQWYKKHGGF